MRILIADDDQQLAARLAEALGRHGMVCDQVGDGEDAAFAGCTEDYAAAVLDLGLPRRDGMSVLRHWRAQGAHMPVLILTGRTRWSDKLQGFGAGADDYLTKPFLMDEAVVRLQALVRRARGLHTPVLQVGPLHYDSHAGSFTLDGERLQFTAQEQRILAFLMHRPGCVVSRAEIAEQVYARDLEPDSNTLDVLIGRIRRKLGRPLIHTERGRGFRLDAGDALD